MESGLARVVVAETVLSRSDGEQGILWVRGYTLPQLVADFGYEGTVALLWEGFAADGLTRARLQAELGAAREAAFNRRGEWLEPAVDRPLAEGLRIALAAQPDASAPAAILAVLPVAVAALLRRQRGEAPIGPDRTHSTAADFLRMTHGTPASAAMGARARRLPDRRHRERSQHLRLCRAHDRVERRLAGLSRARRLVRLHRATAWRRSRAHARHARRSRSRR